MACPRRTRNGRLSLPLLRLSSLRRPLTRTPFRRHGEGVKRVEISDSLFRNAQAAARERGISLKNFLAAAVRATLGTRDAKKRKTWPVPPPGVDKTESRRVERRIASEFGRIDLETWR